MTMPDKIQFLCSCPEYIHGTGKPTKKKTTCKQCKGVKLPFAPIGGTVRMLSTPYVFDANINARNCVGTVRLPSTSSYGRQRPTILCGDHDPYDYLRQSRLLYTNRTNDLNDSQQKFQASIISAPHIQSSSTATALIRPSVVHRPFSNKSSRIINESFSPIISVDPYQNRSILHTTINPYELISSTLHNSEFSPSAHAHLYDLIARNGNNNNNNNINHIHNGGKSNGTVALRNRNEIKRAFNVLETFRPNDLETIKSVSSSSSSSATITPTLRQPPPVPALESLPLSVKLITDNNVSKTVNATAATPIKSKIISPSATSTTSKYKSILKQPVVPARANVNSITDQTTKEINSGNKLNGKRSFSQSLLDEGKHMNSTFKSSIQNSNPKLNGSLQSINTIGNGIKRIINEPKTVHVMSGNATTGRCKKVQFNPEPVLVRPKSIDENIDSVQFIVKENEKCTNVSALKITSHKYNNNKSRLENFGNDSTKLMAQEIGKRCELNRASQRRKPIQRSMSDRRDKGINEKLNFKDTTALRTKQVRASPQQLFQKPLISTCQRPTSPPPKLPTDNNSKKSPAIPQRPPRQQKKTANKIIAPNGTVSLTTQSKIDDAKAARIFGLLPVSTINKNKIKIQPFSNSDIKPVKQVANEMAKSGGGGDSSIQRTSITINSDDCASTINVSDHVNLYHSSVLIKNENAATEGEQTSANDEKTSTTTKSLETTPTIPTSTTINAIETPVVDIIDDSHTEIAIIYHNNNNNKNGKSKKPEVLETISTNVNKTKTLICLDYKNNSDCEQIVTSENESISPRESSSPSDSIKSFNLSDGNIGMKPFADSFILKLLNDPYLSYLLHGLEMKTIAKIIENSMVRLRAIKHDIKSRSTKDTTEMDKLFLNRLHDIIKEERTKIDQSETTLNGNNNNNQHNRIASSIKNSINSRLSPASIDYYQNEMIHNENGLCDGKAIPVRKLYEMLVDSTFWKRSDSSPSSGDSQSSDHQYESICLNCDPIYEEINDKPPPLPINPPPMCNSNTMEKQKYKPMFLGATKYDILSYLVDAKERGIVPEESYTFKFLRRPNDGDIAMLEKIPEDSNGKILTIIRNRDSTGSSTSSGTKSQQFQDDHPTIKGYNTDKSMTSIERNDSGVGSETSKTSRTKYQPNIIEHKNIAPIHLCEDCDDPIELQILETTDIYMPIVCRNCGKKRAERREILWEFIETEKKYSRDLQIIIDEFYRPMLVAGLLTQDQLSAIFLNIEELLENSEAFCGKIRDAFDAANEQADDDLFTVDIGKIILETTSMLCAFESYCIQQAAASLLLANMEKDKELLRIFLRVSQMENAVLRRMNLNSFLMVPVQRVTKYPLLLARLYKVTPSHLESRERLKEAQDKIECHLNRMNREAKDISTKLWRRLSSNPIRARENDIVNIKLRKIAMDLLDWNHDKIHFIVEGKLLITHPTDNNWRKGRTIKLTPVNALLITNELASTTSSDHTIVKFPRYSTNKETAFLLLREKSGRYNLYREPFYLDRCVVCTESDMAEYFEVHEIATKDSFIFKAEDDSRTKHWYTQLQYHAQGTGTWRKRRTALANIMINGMMLRS